MATIKLTRYCKCGDGMEFEISPASHAAKINAVWAQVHSGEGHGEATIEECRAAYRAQEAKADGQ